MFIGKNKDIFEIQTKRGDYLFRFANSFSEVSKEFEDNRIRGKAFENIFFTDDGNTLRSVSWPNLSFWQSYHYLNNQNVKFYLLQMSNVQTNCHYQIAIRVDESRFSLFKTGTIQQWIMKTDEKCLIDQYELITQLLYFCKLHTKLMSVRIQPYMPGVKTLKSTYNLLSKIGFVDSPPLSITKTRMIDLRPSIEEIRSSFSANGRARLKIKSKDDDVVEIKEFFNIETIPFLQKALNASFNRSIKKECSYNFQPLFSNKVFRLGFYFKQESFEPKAFVTGVNHDNIVEYSVGGSLDDPRLRRFPFNHILMWELAVRSKSSGSELLDMGGITHGSEGDPLMGITNFKRLFPGFELSIGREMEMKLRPTFLYFYSLVRKLKSLLSVAA